MNTRASLLRNDASPAAAELPRTTRGPDLGRGGVGDTGTGVLRAIDDRCHTNPTLANAAVGASAAAHTVNRKRHVASPRGDQPVGATTFVPSAATVPRYTDGAVKA